MLILRRVELEMVCLFVCLPFHYLSASPSLLALFLSGYIYVYIFIYMYVLLSLLLLLLLLLLLFLE